MDEEAIQKLSFIEQNLSIIMNQKQNFQKQIFEIENAHKELKGVEHAYKIAGPIMLKKSSKDLIESLNNQTEIMKVRIDSLTKQEKTLREQMTELQKEAFKK